MSAPSTETTAEGYLKVAGERSMRHRYRLLVWVNVFAWLAFFAQHSVTRRPFFMANDVTALALSLLLHRWSESGSAQRMRFCAHATMLTTSVCLGMAGFYTGQQVSVSAWFLTVMPLCASFVMGLTEAAWWALVSSVCCLLLDFSASWFQPLPYSAPGQEIPLSHQVLLLVLGGIAYITRRDEDQKLQALAERNMLVQQQMAQATKQTAELEILHERALVAMRARSEFLAHMSHEIRTPLNGLLGLVSLLPQLKDQQGFDEWTRILEGSGFHLLSVVNNILDFSKLEAGNLNLEQIPFHAGEVVFNSVELHATTAWRKRLDLVFESEPDGLEVIGDPTRVRQVISNLIANAVKFTESGFVRVRLRRLPDGLLQFDVEDSGPGIAPDDLERLFEPFTQGDPSTTRQYGGTGLGLTIASKLVEGMRGQIRVQSTLGLGTTFQVYLPLPPAPARPPASSSNHAKKTEGAPLAIDYVLLLAPENRTTKLLQQRLEDAGLRVLLNESGIAALSPELRGAVIISGQFPPDQHAHFLTLLDRSGQEHASPRLLLTALADTVYRPLMREQKLDGILLWPLRPESIEEQLSPLLDRYTLTAANPVDRAETTALPDSREKISKEVRLLLAEDHPVNRRVALLMLERLGYQVDVAEDGWRVLEALEAQAYDVVLMDMQMPGLDGLATTRRLRSELPAERQPLVVALTANVLREHVEAFRAAGADHFIEKPITLQSLREGLGKALAERTGPYPA